MSGANPFFSFSKMAKRPKGLLNAHSRRTKETDMKAIKAPPVQFKAKTKPESKGASP